MLLLAFASLSAPLPQDAPLAIRYETRDALTGTAVPSVLRIASDSPTPRSPPAAPAAPVGDDRIETGSEGNLTLRREDFPARFSFAAEGYVPLRLRIGSERELRTYAPSGTWIVLLDPVIKRRESLDVVSTRGDDPSPVSIPLRPQQVMKVAGAADNVFRTLQTLPGVAAAEEFSSRLAVRGGGPDQNLTIMDGVEIHNPYRLFGLASAFNPETVETFDLAAGAFMARYGDRLSSILTVENRDGATDRRTQGSATLSVTDGNFLFEGPWSEARREKGSWIVTARRTYYDLIADRIVDEDLPGFQDTQFRGAWQANDKTRLTLFGVRSREGGDARFEGEDTDYGAFVTRSRNDVVSLALARSFSSRFKSKSTLSVYDFAQGLNVDARFEDSGRRSNGRGTGVTPQIAIDFEQEITTRDLAARSEWFFAPARGALFEAGAEAHALRTSARWRIRGDRNLTEANGSSVRGGASLPSTYDAPLRSNRAGFYLQLRRTMTPRLSTETGVRIDRSSLTGTIEVQPRLAALFRVNDSWRVRAAFGRHTQSPGFEKLVQADYFFDLTNLKLRNETSRHITATLELDWRGIEWRVEAYRKTFDHLLVGALETEAERRARVATYDFPASLRDSIPTSPLITSTPENSASGRATGLEFGVTAPRRAPEQRLSGWASYSYGRATRSQWGRTYPFEYDRRHALSLAGQFEASEKLDVSFTLKLSSGFPRTPVAGVRVQGVPDAADLDGDSNLGELIPQRDTRGLPVYVAFYGDVSNLLSARLPSFRRFDLRFNWRPRGLAGRWQIYLDIINATNRTNVARYEPDLRFNPSGERPVVAEEPARAIPFLPSLGVRFRF